MNDDKLNKMENERIDKILNSAKGSRRASPAPHVFDAIERKIQIKANTVTIQHWRWAAAAAVVICAINVYAVFHTQSTNSITDTYSQTTLITNYNPY